MTTFTVSAAVTNFSTLLGLKVFVVTGAAEAGGAAAGSGGTFGVENLSVTPANTGSLILFGISATAGTWTAFTAASNNTLVDNTQEGTTGAGYGDGYYTGTVTSGTPVTVGTSAPSQWNALAAYELIPSSGTTTPLIDASTPALAHGGSTPQVTASFTPPTGAVLVAVVMSDTTATGAVTITDTSGLGLTWTQRGLYQGNFVGLAGIFTTTIPAPGTVLPGKAASIGYAAYAAQETLTLAATTAVAGTGYAAYAAQGTLILAPDTALSSEGLSAQPSSSSSVALAAAGAAASAGIAAQPVLATTGSVTVFAGYAYGTGTAAQPVAGLTYTYIGPSALTYLDYVDARTQQTLTVAPGQSYVMRIASGRPGLTIPPPDGRWLAGGGMGGHFIQARQVHYAEMMHAARVHNTERHARIARGETAAPVAED